MAHQFDSVPYRSIWRFVERGRDLFDDPARESTCKNGSAYWVGVHDACILGSEFYHDKQG